MKRRFVLAIHGTDCVVILYYMFFLYYPTRACTPGMSIGGTRTALCPFTVPECVRYNPEICDFASSQGVITGSTLSKTCEDAITSHCKAHYRDDVDACTDFNDIILGSGGCDYNKLPPTALDALAQGVRIGRNGKGTIFVFASGSDFYVGDDVNMSGFQNSRYTITVGAVGKDRRHTAYSTPGAALLVTAPAGDNNGVSNILTAGLGGTCANSGPGTSFASPVVSGVIALMLEARSELTWRDVQGIIASTSQKVTDAKDISAVTNAAGFWVSNWYGFGIIDAKKAVDAALNWVLWTPEEQAIGASKEEKQPISNDGTVFVSKVTIGQEYKGFQAGSAVVLINLQHYNRGNLKLTLVAPSGTESILLPGRRPEKTQLEGDERWKLMTLRNWGEDPTGEWQLKVQDLVTNNASGGGTRREQTNFGNGSSRCTVDHQAITTNIP